jgi:hypothetical protein
MRPLLQNRIARAGALAVGTATLAIAGCGGSSSQGTTPAGAPSSASPSSEAPTSSQVVGSWLGPAPNNAAQGCDTSTAQYTFNSDNSWSVNLVYGDQCGGGGNFTIGGTYSVNGSDLRLHYATCPESCPPDSTETVTFTGSDAFTMSGVSGTYYRQ